MTGDQTRVSLALPDPLQVPGRLYLWPSDGLADTRLRELASEHQCDVLDAEADGCLAVAIDNHTVLSFLDAVRRGLRPRALEATRALFKQDSVPPSMADFPHANSLRGFIVIARGKWLGELVANEKLRAYFQPIVNADNTTSIHGYEALLRGEGKTDELIQPSRILSAARDAGIMPSLDKHIHEIAIRAFVSSGVTGRLFVNIAPNSLESPDFRPADFASQVRSLGLQPSSLSLELVESETVKDLELAQRRVQQLRQSGFQIVLDDLGSGFSNLDLVHYLRPDVLKLDMELTRRIHEDAFRAVIAEKLLEIAQKLNIPTVAEGVENVEELHWLREHGIDMVQGDLISGPAPQPSAHTPIF